MFYCDPCREVKDWPKSEFVSVGPCEICGHTRPCYDVPSHLLPKSAVDELVEKLMPSAYRVPALEIDSDCQVAIEERFTAPNVRQWAVLRNGSVLNKENEWEFEPLPGERGKEFMERCRYATLEAACQQIIHWQNNLKKTNV